MCSCNSRARCVCAAPLVRGPRGRGGGAVRARSVLNTVAPFHVAFSNVWLVLPRLTSALQLALSVTHGTLAYSTTPVSRTTTAMNGSRFLLNSPDKNVVALSEPLADKLPRSSHDSTAAAVPSRTGAVATTATTKNLSHDDCTNDHPAPRTTTRDHCLAAPHGKRESHPIRLCVPIDGVASRNKARGTRVERIRRSHDLADLCAHLHNAPTHLAPLAPPSWRPAVPMSPQRSASKTPHP